jgi:hypothetical protein
MKKLCQVQHLALRGVGPDWGGQMVAAMEFGDPQFNTWNIHE